MLCWPGPDRLSGDRQRVCWFREQSSNSSSCSQSSPPEGHREVRSSNTDIIQCTTPLLTHAISDPTLCVCVTVFQSLGTRTQGALRKKQSGHHLMACHNQTATELQRRAGSSSSAMTTRGAADRCRGHAPSPALDSDGSVWRTGAGPTAGPASLGCRVTAVSFRLSVCLLFYKQFGLMF